MAGSYSHILDENGEIVSNERFIQMIENLGDAYEMAVDMHEEIQRLRAALKAVRADTEGADAE